MDDLWDTLMQRLNGMFTPNPTTNIASDGIRNPWNMANLPNTPGATSSQGMGLSPTGKFLTTPEGQAEQAAAGNPNMSPMDVVKQSPDDIMEKATQKSNWGEALKELGKGLTPTTPQYQPPPVRMPGYGGGGGGNLPPLQVSSPSTSMMRIPGMPGGGFPLGPAANSDFILAMLKSRLGM